ncbi:MAG: thioredoxin 1 [Gaiellaceae bacterium]|jgi:thioredoxin 1|nr:thioredoxin 1 [Gaiellaceae bacterium]
MHEVTDASFEEDVLGAAGPVLVDFWAPWCKPCEAVEPILEELVESSGGRVGLVRVDIDTNPVAAARYGVLTLPTVLLFADGAPQAEVLGAHSRSRYEHVFSAWL